MLVIIESPNKVKKIAALLNAKTLATVGHFKDLPAGELSVDLATYNPTFAVSEGKADRLKQIKEAAKGQDVYIATDPDREGFAIGTMIEQEIYKIAKSCHRLELHEITAKGCADAMKKSVPWSATNPGLYGAFLGRRIVDRLVGYILSPIASKDLGSKFSVGRVQSPAVRLVVERERAINGFQSTPFFVNSIQIEKDSVAFSASFKAGQFADRAAAEAVIAAVAGEATATVMGVIQKEVQVKPKAPFTTVEIQAAASSALGFSPEYTMSLCQQVFEGGSGAEGLISYHRTDSVRLSPDFIQEIRNHIETTMGSAYLPDIPFDYVSKNSQADAHEGIRPTHMHSFSDCARICSEAGLSADATALYTLVYQRVLASQMAPAVYFSTAVDLDCGGEVFKATGRVLKFDGFLSVYKEAEEEKDGGEEDQRLPPLVVGELVPKNGETLAERKTKPPGRYTEASLVKALEKAGIGRPSTYASIMGTIKNRAYVEIKKSKVYATASGEKLYDYLAANHPWVIDLEMTKKMETFLDTVEAGTGTWQSFCKGVHSKMGYAAPAVRGADGADGVPSEKALKFGNDLAAKPGAKPLPAACLTSSLALRAYIDAALGGSKDKPVGKSAAKVTKAGAKTGSSAKPKAKKAA